MLRVQSLLKIFFVVIMLPIAGCMPIKIRTDIEGPVSVSQASARISDLRSDNGSSYKQQYDLAGSKISAAWQCGNAFQRTSSMQLRAPNELEFDELVSAMQLVLADRINCPWYDAINETVIDLMKQVYEEDLKQKSDVAPESPYRCNVMIKRYKSEWYVGVNVRLVDENGQAITF